MNMYRLLSACGLLAVVMWSAGCATCGCMTGKAELKQAIHAVELRHGKPYYDKHRFVTGDVNVQFGGNTVVDAKMTYNRTASMARFDLANGGVAVFDGKQAWVAPADAMSRARFHLLTWPYFEAVAFKLRDEGVSVQSFGPLPLKGKMHDTYRMTFAAGTGDSPDDWYVLYIDPDSHQLSALAYIVTYGKSDDAQQEPHAVTYDSYEIVDGVRIPTRMSFWNWSEEDGIFGEPIGLVTFNNARFTGVADDAFTAPADAVEDTIPVVATE